MDMFQIGLFSFVSGCLLTGLALYFGIIKRINKLHSNTVYTSDKHQLEISFLHGKQEGAAEAMKRFSVKFEGYIEENSTFFTKFTETGYFTQLMLDGLPVLDRSKTILAIIKESKDKNIENLIAEVTNSVNKAVEAFSGTGVFAIAGKNVKRIKRRA